MTTEELINHLSKFPSHLEVYWDDLNFGWSSGTIVESYDFSIVSKSERDKTKVLSIHHPAGEYID